MEFEFLGFVIKKIANNYVIFKDNKQYYSCSNETEAKQWTVKFRKMLTRGAALKQTPDNIVAFQIPGDEKKTNIIVIPGALDKKEKYIKISCGEKNAQPIIDVQHLDANEILGLLRRAEYILTNSILRNGYF